MERQVVFSATNFTYRINPRPGTFARLFFYAELAHMSSSSSPALQSVSAEQFWQLAKNIPIIDVRSPSEFRQGHIPSAVNLPLFNDDERATIGTTYKQVGRQEAVLKGIDFVGPKLADLVLKAQQIAVDGKILVHCWRGGMRSQSLAQILHLADLQPTLLNGGYKSYRAMVHTSFDQPMNLVVVSGLTGAGKTEALRILESGGEQIVDLEKLANHRGSAFGGIGQLPQPTTEQFENDLFNCLDQLDLNKPVWIEDEGNRVGSVVLPNVLYRRLQRSPAIEIRCDFDQRVSNLVNDYGDLPPAKLIESVEKIQKRLGGLAVKQAIAAVESGEISEAVQIVLAYYDKTYRTAMATMPREMTFHLDADGLTDEQLLDSLQSLGHQVHENSIVPNH